MAKRCKNCDPNKYIDGMAWRGANGYDFSKIFSYNDIGQPNNLGILANVPDMVDAYNPIFSSQGGIGLAKTENEPAYIRGIDRNAGFWFIWDFSKGMTAFGTPNGLPSTATIKNFYIDYTNRTPEVSKYEGNDLVGLIKADYVKNSGSNDIIITTKSEDDVGFENHNLYVEENNNLGLCFDQTGVGYYTSPESNQIYRLNRNSQSFILAGNNSLLGTGLGSTYVKSSDNAWTSSSTSFNRPRGICIKTGDNSVYVADTDNHRICRITQTTQTISNVLYKRADTAIFAGLSEEFGSNDGLGTVARFNKPHSVIVDYSGNNLYVADTENHTIRRITLSGVQGQVTTIAGKANEFGTGDAVDGTGARFNFPRDLAIANGTGLYVVDTNNHTIRVINLNPNLNFPVETIAGVAGQPNYLDNTGSNARFNYPVSLCVESGMQSFSNHNRIFIADRKNHSVRELNINTKAVQTFAGKNQEAGNNRSNLEKIKNRHGTYSQVGQTITITMNNHGYVSNATTNDIGTEIFLNFKTGNGSSNYYLILSIINVNTFTVGSNVSQTTSGELNISSLRSLKFNRPSAIAEDNNRNLYVINFTDDTNANFIRKISGKDIEFTTINYQQPTATYINFTLNNHRLQTGDRVFIRFLTGTPTAENNNYLIVRVDDNTFQITNQKKSTTTINGTAEIIANIYNTPGTEIDKKDLTFSSSIAVSDLLLQDSSSSIFFDHRFGSLDSKFIKIKSILDEKTFLIEDELVATNTVQGKARLNFASQILTSSLATNYQYNGFNIFKDASDTQRSPNDNLKFNEFSPISTTSYLTKKEILKIGYYTGTVTSTSLNITKPLLSKKSLTIVVKDSLNNDPIFVTSSPILMAFKGQLSYYQFTTNIKNGPLYIEIPEKTKDILDKLGLTYDDDNKTLSGLINDSISDQITSDSLEFKIYNDDRSYGQEISFKLLVVSGEQQTNSTLKTRPIAVQPSYIYNIRLDPTVKANNVNISLANFTNMNGTSAAERKFYNISTFPENSFFSGLTFNASTCILTGKLTHSGRGILKICAANTQGKSQDVYIVFNVYPYIYNDNSVGNTFPLSLKLPVASIENIGQNTISIKFRTYGDEIFEFKKITNEEAKYIINPNEGNGRPKNIPDRDYLFSPNDKSDIYKKGRDMDFVEFRPGANPSAESKFWMYIEDPTSNTLKIDGTRPEILINVEGSYTVADGFSPFIDSLGNTCYKPGPNHSGPVSQPIFQNLNLVTSDLIKDSYSADPSKNLPTIQIREAKTGANISVQYQVFFFGIGGGSTLITSGKLASEKLSKSQLLKYPLGIPNSRGTYLFYIGFADTCTFNSNIISGSYQYTPIALYIGTYTRRQGDVYQCVRYVRPREGYRGGGGASVVEGFVPEYYNYTLVNSTLPAQCSTLITQIGAQKTLNGYGFRYTNTFSESKDIGITTLTNISILDVLSEGPIEGISDYEIKPKQCDENRRRDNPELCPQIGDIGWSKQGVKINKYPGTSSYIRSIYWNETPLADSNYADGVKGSLNFDFIKIKFENADQVPQHTHAENLGNINISEDLNSQKIGNGIPLENIYLFDKDGGIISSQAKIPKLLTVTKTIGQKLYGKRIFRNGTSRTYKKSFNILSENLYGLRLHLKIGPLAKTIIDLTIWESFAAAENSATSGRVDRYSAYFKVKLKKINRGTNNEGQIIVPVTYEKDGKVLDFWTINCVGKLTAGSYLETFEWLGLDKIADKNTIGWEVEIEPLHEESNDINVKVESSADSITEIYQDRLIFPHTASVLSTFDARFFASIPQRFYDVRLLKVKIPSNYNPYSKTYEGIWDGRFVLGWTDNPAWCFYDIVTNSRFGLGKYVDSKFVDKWTLFDVGKYCDQLVSDGRGGLEPRFTCNILISTREDAYKVLNDMASIFRGIVYYNAGLIFTNQDKPKEPIYLFNNSNVRNGEFTYSDTSKRVRRNVVLVRYNNKDNFFKPAVKYVENREGLIRFGIKETDVTAFGCTSEGQAERLGKWVLLSENLESEVVSFETSLPALYLKPGDIVLLQDENRQNKILGGRTLDLNKNYAILDLKYSNLTGYKDVISGCKFNVLTPAGNIEIGTPSGNKATEVYYENSSGMSVPLNINGVLSNVSEIDDRLLRRSQVQYRDLGLSSNGDSFFSHVSEETGINYSGFTRINLSTSPLDDAQHTLLSNTVWTLEVDPNFYNYVNSPTVRGIFTSGIYPGASLEPNIDRTQKFRILDLEEKEDYLYKITALQYREEKFSEADDI